MPTVKCKNCGKSFYIKASAIKRGRGKYCSLKCRCESPLYRQKIKNRQKGHSVSEETKKKISKANKGRRPPKPFPKGNIPWNKGLHIKTNDALNRWREKGGVPWNKGRHYAEVAGENNYRWKGGYKPYYGKNWRSQRRKALNRDGYKCRMCGKTEDENGRKPDVHHIIPFSEFGIEKYRQANLLTNLITLCMSCHCTVEHRREKEVMVIAS